jgi:tetratricopeptide (TPR) repeat protein
MARAGQGLVAAHAAGIVHRDFKPENVLVEPGPAGVKRVVVTDFGVARAYTGERETTTDRPRVSQIHLTRTGTAVGTPAYMAPEQLEGADVDARADVFAFAVTTWELVYGERPFFGRDVDEIRAAMNRAPVPPRDRDVPARVRRVLDRGLRIDRSARWPDIDSFVRALVRAAASRRKLVIGAAAGAVLAGAAAFAIVAGAGRRGDDPCAGGFAALDGAYDARRAAAVREALAGDPKTRDAVIARLDKAAADWRTTHRATCRPDAEPAQSAKTVACLDARRLELATVGADLIADRGRHAAMLAALVGEPTGCADPAPGLLAARVPTEPAGRRTVTELRYRLFDAELARDTGDYTGAINAATDVARRGALLWPPLQAEAMYVLGTAQTFGGSNREGMVTLRDAAALAERVHHDHIAANVWTQLGQSTAFDAGDPARALEYLTYAEAAVDRIGKPPANVVMLEYVRGTVLIEADRQKDGEVALWRAFTLAETKAPEFLPQIIQGFGYLYEDQGKYDEAVEAYRRALAKLATGGPVLPATEVIVRQRLALSLAMLAHVDEAEAEARKAVALAERTMGEDNLDRAIAHVNLAQVLQQAGRFDAALAEAEASTKAIANILGDRSERYGEALSLEANILADLGRFADAEQRFVRACEIIAFGAGAESSVLAECWINETNALAGLNEDAGALALVDKALPILIKAYGENHPQVATAYVIRGALRANLDKPGATDDLERGRALFAAGKLDPGHLAAAEWALGKRIYKQDKQRGCELIEEAVLRFEGASASWGTTRKDAEEWLATHDDCDLI